jgi:hypothetical protein
MHFGWIRSGTLQMSRHRRLRFESPLDVGDRPEAVQEAGDRSGGRAASGAYNEAEFRYFMVLERKRAALANRPFLLLLVDLKAWRAAGVMESDVTERLFSTLSQCLRGTDFVGWYQEGRVVGAVLTQHAIVPASDVWRGVSQRVTRALGESLPADLAGRVQVRVCQVPGVGLGERA